MSTSVSKQWILVLGAICLLLLLLGGYLFIQYSILQIKVAFAEEQTEIFEEMREKALQGDAARAAECLQYAVNYYPSGSKQVAGSRLDKIVERARSRAVVEIVSYLRTETGEDLGDSPGAWIQKYVRR